MQKPSYVGKCMACFYITWILSWKLWFSVENVAPVTLFGQLLWFQWDSTRFCWRSFSFWEDQYKTRASYPTTGKTGHRSDMSSIRECRTIWQLIDTDGRFEMPQYLIPRWLDWLMIDLLIFTLEDWLRTIPLTVYLNDWCLTDMLEWDKKTRFLFLGCHTGKWPPLYKDVLPPPLLSTVT